MKAMRGARICAVGLTLLLCLQSTQADDDSSEDSYLERAAEAIGIGDSSEEFDETECMTTFQRWRYNAGLGGEPCEEPDENRPDLIALIIVGVVLVTGLSLAGGAKLADGRESKWGTIDTNPWDTDGNWDGKVGFSDGWNNYDDTKGRTNDEERNKNKGYPSVFSMKQDVQKKLKAAGWKWDAQSQDPASIKPPSWWKSGMSYTQKPPRGGPGGGRRPSGGGGGARRPSGGGRDGRKGGRTNGPNKITRSRSMEMQKGPNRGRQGTPKIPPGCCEPGGCCGGPRVNVGPTSSSRAFHGSYGRDYNY